MLYIIPYLALPLRWVEFALFLLASQICRDLRPTNSGVSAGSGTFLRGPQAQGGLSPGMTKAAPVSAPRF